MKVNMTTVLTGLDGQPIDRGMVPREAVVPAALKLRAGAAEEALMLLDGICAARDPACLRDFCCNALVAQYKGDENLEGKEKLRRWRLAEKVHSQDEPELTSQEITLLKDLLGKAYSPVVVGPAWTLLDPAETEATTK